MAKGSVWEGYILNTQVTNLLLRKGGAWQLLFQHMVRLLNWAKKPEDRHHMKALPNILNGEIKLCSSVQKSLWSQELKPAGSYHPEILLFIIVVKVKIYVSLI